MDFAEQIKHVHFAFRHRFLEGKIPYSAAERYYRKKEIADKYIKVRKLKDEFLYKVNIQSVEYDRATPAKRRCMTAPSNTPDYQEYIRQQNKMNRLLDEFRKV